MAFPYGQIHKKYAWQMVVLSLLLAQCVCTLLSKSILVLSHFVCCHLYPDLVVLCDDWARRHQLLVDYGVSLSGQAPNLLLRSKRLRLFPVSSPQVASGSSTLKCNLIFAQQAKRLLATRRSNCKSPFLILVSEACTTSATPWRSAYSKKS
jgi:hypothetical protein